MTSTTAGARLGGRPGLTRAVPAWKRAADPKVAVLIVGFLIVWQVASGFAPDFVVPKITEVAARMGRIVTTRTGLDNLLTTLLRVGIGLACAFVAGTVIGLVSGAHRRLAGYLLPAIRFIQGIPSLSWVVIAVIWFASVELRVWFVMVLVTLPGFALQAYDSYRSIPAELHDMGRSFRPRPGALFREITLPAITPGLFTAWKVNLGLGIRMVLVAELVGATMGVGAQLLSAQQLFDMAAVIAWTLLLAVCMLILQGVIEAIETRVLRYRAVSDIPAQAAQAVPAPAGNG